jgi:MFS transporter, DHA1 family, inner membrane transport protein
MRVTGRRRPRTFETVAHVPAQAVPAARSAARPQWPLARLLTLSAAVFLSVTTEMVPTGLLPSMSRDLGVSISRLGLLVTGYAFMVALLATPLGAATARLHRRALLLGCLGGYALSNLVMVFADDYSIAVAGRLIGGATHGAFWAMLGSYTARLVTPDRTGRAIALVSAGGGAAMLLGVPACTALGVAIGWRGAFGMLVAFSIALILLSRRLLPELPGTAPEHKVKLIEVARTPGVAILVFSTALLMLGYFSFFTYIAPYLQNAGLSEAAIGPALLGYGLAGIVGLVATTIIIDKRPGLAMMAGAGVLSTAFILLALDTGAVVVITLALAMLSIALGTLPVVMQALTLRVAPRTPDQASALNASAFNTGIGGGALLGGIVLDHWGVAALPTVAAALVVAGLVTVMFGRTTTFAITANTAPTASTAR